MKFLKNLGVPEPTSVGSSVPVVSKENLVSTALVACIEALEAENSRLKKVLSWKEGKKSHFSMEHIKQDDKLVSFYTGFHSYMVFMAFFQFLGPAVNKLNYWGMKTKSQQ